MASGLRTLALGVIGCLVCFVSVAPHAQAPGHLAGRVTDTQPAALPGAKVTLTGPDVDRRAITDDDGRFEFRDPPPGRYTVQAELAGFRPATAHNVEVRAGSPAGLSLALEIGCVDEALCADLGFFPMLREASAVLHIRITQSGQGERCDRPGLCVCTEHLATVERTLKGAPPGASAAAIRLLQEGAGQLADMRYSGPQTPHAPGEEYIAFLHWDQKTDRFRMSACAYEFPVRGGRVQFDRTDAPGLTEGMPVEDFARAFRALCATQTGAEC